MSKGKSKWVIIFELFIIVLGLTSVTLAVKYIMDSYNLSVSTSSLAVADLNESVTSGELIPLEDSSITKDTTDNVLRMTFNVKGAVANTNSNIIYDIVLKDIVADCTLKNENIKWNLYKNNELLSTGSFAPSFDADILDNTLTLTSTQENLKSYISSGDEYIFILWMSEPCTSSDITTCIGVLDNSNMLGETVSASIDVRLYTGKKKAINRSTFNTKACNIIRGNINDGIYNLNDSTGTNNVTTTGGVYAVSHDAIDASKSATSETIAATTDYRYYGKNPNNYVWFNCSTLDTNGHSYGESDYEYNTTNCEKWRMIGSFETDVPIYGDDGNITGYDNKYLTKIIRSESIGTFSWDNKEGNGQFTGTYYGSNDWNTSRLMKILNPGFETNDEDNDGTYESNSLYYNHSNGICFNGRNSNTIDSVTTYSAKKENCSFSNNGLKEQSYNYIQSVRWLIGGGFNSCRSKIDTNYLGERNNNKSKYNTSTFWNGLVALMYPSDYVYAAGSLCSANTSYDEFSKCANYNYLQGIKEWLFSNSSYWTSMNLYTYAYGSISGNASPGNCSYNCMSVSLNNVRPTLYLKEDTTIIKGLGTSESPYIIILN